MVYIGAAVCICGRNTKPRHVGIINSSVVVVVAGICPEYSIIAVAVVGTTVMADVWLIGSKGGGVYAGTHRGQRIGGVAPRTPVSARQSCGTVAAQMLIGIFLRAVVAALHEEGLQGFFFTKAAHVLRRPYVDRRCTWWPCVYCGRHASVYMYTRQTGHRLHSGTTSRPAEPRVDRRRQLGASN